MHVEGEGRAVAAPEHGALSRERRVGRGAVRVSPDAKQMQEVNEYLLPDGKQS